MSPGGVDAAAEVPLGKGKMPGVSELPEQHPGGSTNGDKTDAQSSTARPSDQAAADADQTAVDTDQTLSDADQTLSDADQSVSEHDQVQSDADQRASDRDQAASDRDRSAHDSTDANFAEAHAASHTERTHSTVEREAASEERGLTGLERSENAGQRDEQAARRDLQAAVRDRTAAFRDRAAGFRDQAAEAYGRALGRESTHTSGPRATAAADRARAAEDRDRAVEDRKQAALDRAHGRTELEKAQLDDLTGFYRRALGKTVLQREIDRSRRSDGRLIFAYCDVDGLKQVNDERGHAAGDALLQALADAIRSRLRSYDPVVRVGGDEFICALPETDMDQARGMVQEIQNVLAERWDGASMTFGLASLRAEDSLGTLMERSDEALREAKSAST